MSTPPTLRFTVDLVDPAPVLDHYKPEQGEEQACCDAYANAIRNEISDALIMRFPIVTCHENVVSILFTSEPSPEVLQEIRSVMAQVSRPGIRILEVAEGAAA